MALARFKTVHSPINGLFVVYDTFLSKSLLKFRDEDAADDTVDRLNSVGRVVEAPQGDSRITAIQLDSWDTFETVEVDTDTYTDSDWEGCEYRISSGVAVKDVAVNVKLTGRKSFPHGNAYRTRCEVEFVGDGQPSTFYNGLVWSTADLFEGKQA